MNRGRRVAVLAELAEQMRTRGSWCGETHLQKATYILEELMEVPLDYEFILYKHGPFSFDLRDELTAMRADGLLALLPQPFPYGPSLVATPASQELRQRYPKTLKTYAKEIVFVADRLSSKGVNSLEKLATAIYVGLEEHPDDPVERLTQLKPHVSKLEARAAVEEANSVISESGHA